MYFPPCATTTSSHITLLTLLPCTFFPVLPPLVPIHLVHTTHPPLDLEPIHVHVGPICTHLMILAIDSIWVSLIPIRLEALCWTMTVNLSRLQINIDVVCFMNTEKQ